MVLYLVEQLPHCDLLRLIHQTERFVCWLASLSIKSVMDSFIFLFFFWPWLWVGWLPKTWTQLAFKQYMYKWHDICLMPLYEWQDMARHDWYPFLRVMLLFLIVILQWVNVYGHITLKTPVLVWSLKLSNVEPRQYLDGWLPGNTRCCRQFIF